MPRQPEPTADLFQHRHTWTKEMGDDSSNAEATAASCDSLYATSSPFFRARGAGQAFHATAAAADLLATATTPSSACLDRSLPVRFPSRVLLFRGGGLCSWEAGGGAWEDWARSTSAGSGLLLACVGSELDPALGFRMKDRRVGGIEDR